MSRSAQPDPSDRQPPTGRRAVEHDQAPRVDVGFLAIIGLVTIVAAWLLAMPLVPAISTATMNRFHLCSKTFAGWAIQQPIPAMYNLANRYEIYRQLPASWSDPTVNDHDDERLEAGYVNHFPSRLITFANARARLLREQEDRWYQLESSYRGRTLTTRWHVGLGDQGRLELQRLADPSGQP